jgi:hypothetical protein
MIGTVGGGDGLAILQLIANSSVDTIECIHPCRRERTWKKWTGALFLALDCKRARKSQGGSCRIKLGPCSYVIWEHGRR